MGKNGRGRGLCIVVARGGSKGLPNKNLRLLCGRPLLHYTLDAVLEARSFERIVLSTDNVEIAEEAKLRGVDVPFMRPSALATDSASALDVVRHALMWIERTEGRYDYVQYIFPTTPLKTSADIKAGICLLFEKDADMVISVCETDHPSQWTNTLPPSNALRNFVKKKDRRKNRQDLQKTYRINGCIYVGRWEVFAKKRDWFDVNTYAYVMPQERSVDIDTKLDFQMAEILMGEQLHAQL